MAGALIGKRDATETSPLLANESIEQVEPIDAIATNRSDTSEQIVVPTDNAQDGASLERHESQQDRERQYTGMPEVKKQMKFIFPAMAIGVFLVAADQTLITSTYGSIGTDLSALNMTSWIATAYFLTLTSFQPLYGKLSDIFGRKACILFGYTVFAFGCLLCGLSQNIEQLIIARAVAGIGGGGVVTTTSVLLSDIVSLRERGTWQGYINVIYAAGASCGAPLGGVAADGVGWRWAFLIQPPLTLIAIVAVVLALHLPKQDDTHWNLKLKRVDFGGAAVLITALFLLLVALDRGSNISWGSALPISCLATSLPLLILFVLYESKVAKEPFAPGGILFARNMFACYICNFFSMAGYVSMMFYLPLDWQAVDGLSSTQAGLLLIPSAVVGVSGSVLGRYYMKRTGKYYWLTIIGYFVLASGMLVVPLLSRFSPSGSRIGVVAAYSIAGFGYGAAVVSTLISLIANASHEDQAVATACSYLFRSLGSVSGISLSATVANIALRRELATELPHLGLSAEQAAEIAEGVRQSLAYLRDLDGEVRDVVRICYARSTQAAYALQVALAVGAFVFAWFNREKGLGK